MIFKDNEIRVHTLHFPYSSNIDMYYYFIDIYYNYFINI